MSLALARYLKDFSQPQPAASAFSPTMDDNDFGDVGFDAPVYDEPEVVDVDTVRREAYAEGFETATAELDQQHSDAVAALEARHQEELEALRTRFEQESADLIATKIPGMAEAVAHCVSEQVAEALAPVLTDLIAEKTVAGMADMLRRAILDGASGTIIVRGSAHLFDILKSSLGDDAALLRHLEEPDLDLSIEVDGTILVSRMSAWADSLKKVLE